MLYFVLALDALIGLGTVSFPASVACLLILFFALILAEFMLNHSQMEQMLKVVDVPSGFALRTMNLYFTPSFILLPLSQMIGGTEIGVLIGVFIIGYILQLALTAYASRAIQFLLRKFHLSKGLPSQAPGTRSVTHPLIAHLQSTVAHSSTIVLQTRRKMPVPRGPLPENQRQAFHARRGRRTFILEHHLPMSRRLFSLLQRGWRMPSQSTST